MKSIGLQLYSIRDKMKTEEDIYETLKKVKEMGYEYVQFSGTYDCISAENLAKAAKESGLPVCGAHYAWDRIQDDVEGTIKRFELLGTNQFGIGAMPKEARNDLAELNLFIKKFNEMADIYYARGFRLLYHHHSFEFKKLDDGKTIFDHLVEELDPVKTGFIFDTYWAQHGGQNIVSLIKKLEGRIAIMHLKDMEAAHEYTLKNDTSLLAPCITRIGDGVLDFEEIIKVSEETGIKYFVVEDDNAPSTGDSLAAARKSCAYIHTNLIEK